MFPGGPNPNQAQFVPPAKRLNPPLPLVLIHDGGGTTFSYFLIGSLDRDVWAVHNPKFFEGEAWDGGMDEMAARYIQLLLDEGIRGPIMLGGWSLGGYLSITMARMLADDPEAKLSVAGLLLIDSPHHIARSKITAQISKPSLTGIPSLVQKSFENCNVMLKYWDLPTWEGPASGGEEVKFTVQGREYAVGQSSVLHKPVQGEWTAEGVKGYDFGKPENSETRAEEPRRSAGPPPAVLVRCLRAANKAEGAGDDEPCIVDLCRDELLLGWDGKYPDFIKAVIDVDTDHYSMFNREDLDMLNTVTASLKEGMEILDSIHGPTKPKAPAMFN